MLRFFRTIRKKLIEQDNIRKYLLYAIGEILLVVIGILIALQINTWNQQRIEAQKESRYISELNRDLNSQLQEIQYLNETLSSSLERLNMLIDLLDENEPLKVNEKIASLFFSIYERTSFTIKDPIYQELIATGNIELIRNKELRNSIIQYYQRLEKAVLIIQKNNDSNDLTIKPRALQLVEIWPPGFALLPNSSGTMSEFGRSDFPDMHNVFNRNLADEQKLFEIYNLIKMQLLISASNLEEINIAEQLTVDLIDKLEDL